MAVFVRRFQTDPGDSILLNIESVNVLDLDPPAAIAALGTGTVLIVGEFENGIYNAPVQVGGATDLSNSFGGLGYTYAGVPGNNPCAVSRKADSAIAAELWNGNAAAQLNGKQFANLVVCRADTSVGSVQFTPLAFITSGTPAFRYTLTSGQILSLDIGAGAVSSTFTGAAAVLTTTTNVFPSTFAGGETLTLQVDGGTPFTVTFLAADSSQAAVIARINAYAGFTLAASASGTSTTFTGIQKGTGGSVKVVAASSLVLTCLNASVGTTNGTGNVANIAAITSAEVKTIVEAAVSGTRVETDQNGALRISNLTSPGSITVGVATTALGLGFVVGQTATQAVSVPTNGLIPAGTIVQNSGGTRVFVTTQDVSFAPSGITVGGVVVTSPYSVKIRHAVDDGTGLSSAVSTVTSIPTAIAIGSYSVTNAVAVTAALTEAAIDVAYITALNATLDINTVAKLVNIVYSARQSNAVRRALKANALAASSKGCYGRIACLRTPLGTTKAAAQSTTIEPGVGAYRDQRVIFCFPQASTYVPVIAARGTAGGTGFTATGMIDIGADGFMAAICSQLPPEENPGQDTVFTAAAVGLESSPNAAGYTMDDYIAFKASGIAALRMDGGVAGFQSGVTSVDPSVYPQLADISRRRMADFIQDSISNRLKAYGKKLATVARRKGMVAEIRSFLRTLLSANNPALQRIAGFTVDDKSGNTPQSLGNGQFRIIVKVRTLASFLSIVLQTSVGTQVTVDEQLPAQAA